jgi:hypothetical protein
MQIRQLISALVGSALLVGTAVEGYFQSFGFYQEHYVWPKEKYGVLTPLRWQDITFLVTFWVGATGLLYVSYRLLKYSRRRKLPLSSSSET